MCLYISLFLGTEDAHVISSFLECKNQTLCDPSDGKESCSYANKEVGICVLHLRKHAKQVVMKK